MRKGFPGFVMRAHAAESEAYAACGALYDKVARRLSRFAAQQESGRWMGFELEPEEEEFDFYEFDSVPGRDHAFCWSVGYGGCKAACSRL